MDFKGFPDTRHAARVIVGKRGCVTAALYGSRSVATDLGSKIGQSISKESALQTMAVLSTMEQ